MSLDWQEFPGDYLNLTTQRSYTIREVRDLINRHLLDRGYTLLCQGESLTVVNIKKLDTAIVPRIEPEELDQATATPTSSSRCRFPWTASRPKRPCANFEPLKSANGKLNAMVDANRVEAMDTVANLRDMYCAR